MHQDPETPQTLSQNCVWVPPVVIRVSSGLLKGQGLWVKYTCVWHKPSWRRSPLTPPKSLQNLHRTGETDSWRAQTKPYAHQDPGERSGDPTRDWPRLARECWAVSGGGMGRWQSAAGLGALNAAGHTWGLFEGGCNDLHYLHHSLASGQTTGREHSPPIGRKQD